MQHLERELDEVVLQVASIQLGWQVHPVAHHEEAAEMSEALTAVVEIGGGWTGAVHLRVHREVARSLAATMFARPAEVLELADARDALGELANMVAGNLKGRLPGSSWMSPPTVVEGRDHEVTRLGSELAIRGRYRSPAGSLEIELLRSVERDA